MKCSTDRDEKLARNACAFMIHWKYQRVANISLQTNMGDSASTSVCANVEVEQLDNAV